MAVQSVDTSGVAQQHVPAGEGDVESLVRDEHGPSKFATCTRRRRVGLIKVLERHGQLAVAWGRHGSPVPRWILTRYT